jgi:hypothetical protein
MQDRPFALLGVYCDLDPKVAVAVMEKEQITRLNWHDGRPGEGPIAKSYHIRACPTVVVLDAQGIICYQGPVFAPYLEQLIGTLLAQDEVALSGQRNLTIRCLVIAVAACSPLSCPPAASTSTPAIIDSRPMPVRITAAAHQTFGAWNGGAHGDPVIAVALAMWVGGRRETDFEAGAPVRPANGTAAR